MRSKTWMMLCVAAMLLGGCKVMLAKTDCYKGIATGVKAAGGSLSATGMSVTTNAERGDCPKLKSMKLKTYHDLGFQGGGGHAGFNPGADICVDALNADVATPSSELKMGTINLDLFDNGIAATHWEFSFVDENGGVSTFSGNFN